MSKGRVTINREGSTITRAWSILATGLLIAGLVLTSVAQAAPAQQAGTLDGMSFGVYLSPPLVDWYNQVARPEDLGSINMARAGLWKRIPTVSSSAFFQAERFIIAHRNGARIETIPVEHLVRQTGKSSFSSPMAAIRSFWDLVVFRFSARGRLKLPENWREAPVEPAQT